MECPNCGKTDNEVIDSRLIQDGIAIRRRRQCLICSTRFTTYEAAEERLLPFLIRKKARNGAAIKDLKKILSKLLSEETKRHRKVQAAKEAKKKARERKAAKRKEKSLMMTETVLKIVKRHKMGIDISKLKNKTGFDGKKIHNIVFKLKKEGKIKSPHKGFYVKA